MVFLILGFLSADGGWDKKEYKGGFNMQTTDGVRAKMGTLLGKKGAVNEGGLHVNNGGAH